MSSEATFWMLAAAPFEARFLRQEARGRSAVRDLFEACLAECKLEELAPGWDFGSDLVDTDLDDLLEGDALEVYQAFKRTFEDGSACGWLGQLFDVNDAQGAVVPPGTLRPLVDGLRRTRALLLLDEKLAELDRAGGYPELDALLARAAAQGAWVVWMTTG